jgi:transcriptional regulator with XRE-family HTH domain
MAVTGHENDLGFGIILAILRTRREWNQRKLAQTARVSRSAISDYERGKVIPELKTLNRMVLAMGYPLWAIDHTRAFIRSLDYGNDYADASLPPSSPAARLSQELDALAAEGSRTLGQLFRRALAIMQESASEVPLKSAAPELQNSDPTSPEALLQELVNLPFKKQRLLVKQEVRFHDWRLAVSLSDRSLRSARAKPALAVECADLARLVAERLTGDPAKIAKVRWYVLAHLGNAQRAGGNLLQADKSFQAAGGFFALGAGFTNALIEEARVPALLASLRLSQNRLTDCIECLDVALSLNPSRALRASILVNKARALEETEQFEEALASLDAAESCIDDRKDPELFFCARQNRLDILSKAERYAEAHDLLPAVKRLRHGSALDRVRLVWSEGRILAALGNIDRGIELLSGVRAELVTRGIAYDAALASLELAGLYAQRGNTEAVKSLAGHMATIFNANAVHREALAALAFFRQAAEREEVTADLTKRLASYLSRARHNPDLRFEAD